MKSTLKTLLALFLLQMVLTGCEKCKDCVFYEADGKGSFNVHPSQEACGDDLELFETQTFVAGTGYSYFECR